MGLINRIKENINARRLMGLITDFFDAVFNPHKVGVAIPPNPYDPPLPGPGPDPGPGPGPCPGPNMVDDQLIIAINSERREHGLVRLDRGPIAMDMAQNWAAFMAKNETMKHGDFENRITHAYPNTAGGEDIAAGQETVAAVMDAWMHSPPHRANILGNFNTIGVGFALGANNIIYWCIDFVNQMADKERKSNQVGLD